MKYFIDSLRLILGVYIFIDEIPPPHSALNFTLTLFYCFYLIFSGIISFQSKKSPKWFRFIGASMGAFFGIPIILLGHTFFIIYGLVFLVISGFDFYLLIKKPATPTK